MAITPLINGHRYSYASIELTIKKPTGNVDLFVDVDSISYSEALDVAFRRGTGQAPIGWTSGVYEPGDATIQMGKSTFQSGIVQGIGPGWMGAVLGINVNYIDIGEILTTDHLEARIVGAEDSHSAGPDALFTTLTIKPFIITRNGITPLLNHVI